MSKRLFVKYPKLASLFEVLNFLLLIALFIMIVMIIWEINEEHKNTLIKLALSDFIGFITTLILYRLCCYSTTNN
jgi:hypothetical protein